MKRTAIQLSVHEQCLPLRGSRCTHACTVRVFIFVLCSLLVRLRFALILDNGEARSR